MPYSGQGTYQKDPRKRPPAGWKVKNILFQKMLTNAQRTQCQSLIEQVEALQDAPRSDLAKLVDTVSRCSKGDIDPATVNLQQILDSAEQEAANVVEVTITADTVSSTHDKHTHTPFAEKEIPIVKAYVGDKEIIRGQAAPPLTEPPLIVNDPHAKEKCDEEVKQDHP